MQQFKKDLAEAQGFLDRGLITKEQFDKEKDRLTKTRIEAEDKGKPTPSVSFNAYALIAQGMGGGQAKDMVQQTRILQREAVEQQRIQRKVAAGIDGLRDDIRRVMPFKYG